MAKVRILPDRVANQIAAGEVIERPAAVVKELLENALDAGATRVEVEFRHGGRSLMRIEDNGHGMSRDDALLALERHATSKIVEAADLDRLASYGFRGEALPSIASVSRFELQTREQGSDAGTEILVNGGKFVHVRDCGRPVGTRMEVTHLFNSVPARRKFLKTGAAAAVGLVLPELNGKLTGFSMRVPTINVSVVDLSFVAVRETTKEEIDAVLKAASEGPLKGVLGYNSKPLVSIDFNHNPNSSVYDSTLTQVMGGTLVKVCSWYDNEWGFSNRMLDMTAALMNAK